MSKYIVNVSIILISILILSLTDPTNVFNSFCASLAVLANSIVRIVYPSSYVPAAQVYKGFYKGPVFARFLATVGEFVYYYTLGYALNCLEYVLPLTVLGETISWVHLLLQSELLGFIEDFCWFIVNIIALFSYYSNLGYISFSNSPILIAAIPYFSYVLYVHFPNSLRRSLKSPITKQFEIKYEDIDEHNTSWITLSMLYQPLCYALFKYMILVD